MRPAEFAIFVTLAAGLHVAAWQLAPRQWGSRAEGAPGAATPTLAAATPRQAALARAWTAAPPHAPTPARPTTPPAEAAPARPAEPPRQAAFSPSPVLVPVLADTPPRPDPSAADPGLAPESAPTVATAPLAPPAPPPPQHAAAAPLTRRPDPTPDKHLPPPTDRPEPPRPAPPQQATPAPPPAPPQAASGKAAPRRAPGQKGTDRTHSSAAHHNRLLAQWGARIQSKLHRRLIYPRGASGAATARIALTVTRTGRLADLRLIRSSGIDAFDKAALSAVRRVRRFPAAPKGLSRNSYTFTLTLRFRP